MTGAGSGGQGPPDGLDSEEAEKCPVCLAALAGRELSMPDSCCHVFCLQCLLTWAELQMSPSCPVDRKPFINIYRWDSSRGLVQVQVQRRAVQTEAESCCCRNPEKKVCLKRSRRQKTERMANSKTRGLVRKCNNNDPSSLGRKKVRAIECCTWSPIPSITSTQEVEDPVWLMEDGPFDTELKLCKPQAQHCPWLSSAAPIPAGGTLRQLSHGRGWNNNRFPFGPTSLPFTSSSPFRPRPFVFQSVVCAITCPKGGEKRGGRSSSSKAPTKQPESLPSRRSGRNSRTQEESPASDSKSPRKLSVSDSDSSAGQSTKPTKPSQVPIKRKGKRVTNRKASGKRKATRKNSCSTAASEEEEEEAEGDGGDSNEMMEDPLKEQQVNNSEQLHNDAEGILNEEQSGLYSNDAEGGAESLKIEETHDETQEQSGEQQQEEEAGEDNSKHSCSSPLACDSPISGSEDKREEEPASSVTIQEKEYEEEASHSPPDSHNTLLEPPMSPQSGEHTEQDNDMEISVPSQEAHHEDSSEDLKDSVCKDLTQSGFPKTEEPEENIANQEAGTSKETNFEIPESAECLEDKSDEPKENAMPKEDITTPKEDNVPQEDLTMSKEDTAHHEVTTLMDDCMSKDDTNVVPMDCGSPMSEHGNDLIFEPSNDKTTVAAAAKLPAPETQVAKDDFTKRHQERERSQERKNGKQRRSRFHSPTSTWSPQREAKKEPSRRSRSRERDGSLPSSRPSRARSRDRDRDGERDYSRRDRSHPDLDQEPDHTEEGPALREDCPGNSLPRGRNVGVAGGLVLEVVLVKTDADKEALAALKMVSLLKILLIAKAGQKILTGSQKRPGGTLKSGAGTAWAHAGEISTGAEETGWSHAVGLVAQGLNVAGVRGRVATVACTTNSCWLYKLNFSGTGNNSGNDSYSRFNENRGGGRKKESDAGDSMLDRSGWSSASSWAVRKTLPADVQDYYSKRERGGPSSWNRQEEETQSLLVADPPKIDPSPQVIPGNAPVAVMSVLPPHPSQMGVLHHQYPIQTLPVTLQPAAPYAMPPQVPVHVHPAVPLLQLPAVGAQSLPPPPPPPPPMQAGNQTSLTTAQPDGHTTRMVSTVVGFIKPTLLPTPTKVSVAAVTQGQVQPSSTTQSSQHSKAQADSSKKEKKQQIQEKAVNEVKTAIKPFYQKKEITKEEYKEIVRKAVEKVCHSKSGEVNSSKVANLVKAYVDKYKHARKK
uniref:SR-related CTD-associated factor 11 n=1 Tax=Nothobranchius kuhntae TaxID=321403 RepID=A0A1A8J5V7_NOTKU